MFSGLGFELCDNGVLEAGFAKIALYAKGGEFMHVALQSPQGKWSSKIGGLEDIEHDTLEVLQGDAYGYPKIFMKKKHADQQPLL